MNIIITVISMLFVKTIYCDIDGTLLDESLDITFKYRRDVVKMSKKDLFCWYDNCGVDDLCIDYVLMSLLVVMKILGKEIIVWTNRGEEQREMTERNLGMWMLLFDDSLYCCGKKSVDLLVGDCITIDNEEEHVSTMGVQWKR